MLGINIFTICYKNNLYVNNKLYIILWRYTSNTHCSTFSESNGNLTNLSSNYFTTSNDIICKAVNCHYNANHTCTADSVHVNDSHVNCDTFIND